MASQKRQLLTRLNAIINEKEKMKMSNSFIRKTGLSLLTLLFCSAILGTGLFARDNGRLSDRTVDKKQAPEKKVQKSDEKDEQFKMEVIAVKNVRDGIIYLEGLDGLRYKVLNSKQQLRSGFDRLPPDVLYCTVTIMKQYKEGADVILGPWGNGSPMTEQGKELEETMWEEIKAVKKQLGKEQWLRFHEHSDGPKRD